MTSPFFLTQTSRSYYFINKPATSQSLHIFAPGASSKLYVESLRINGQAGQVVNEFIFKHSQIEYGSVIC